MSLFVPGKVLRWVQASVECESAKTAALILGNLTAKHGGHFCVSTANLDAGDKGFYGAICWGVFFRRISHKCLQKSGETPPRAKASAREDAGPLLPPNG
jgi:hypothetical protein